MARDEITAIRATAPIKQRLIGLTVIFQYPGGTSVMPLALFAEAVFGGLLNLVNVGGDVAAIVTDDAKEHKIKA